MAKGKILTDGKPWKGILLFAIPVFAGMLLQQLYNTADTIIVGNFIGENALSSVGTTACLTMLFLALATGFSAGAGVILAQLFGAKQENELRKNAAGAIVLLLLIGILTTIAGIIFCNPALRYVLAVPEQLIEMSALYFKLYCLGLVFQFGYNIVAAILRAVGDSKASFYFLLISSVINIVLDLLFVAVFHWGVAGAAIATDLAQAVSCIVAFWYMQRKYPIFRFHIKEIKWHTEISMRILSIGFPMALQQAVVSLGIIFIQHAVNGYGQAMTASFTVGQRIEYYLKMTTMSFQVTMATYVGQNIGNGKMDRVIQGAKQVIVLSLLITACISVLVFAFAGQIAGLFGLTEQALFYAVQHLRATAIVMIVLASYYPLLGVFQGAGDGFAATVVATAALTFRVIAVYTLCNLALFGYKIIWWSQIFGFTVAFMIAWTHFFGGKWKNKKVIENKKISICQDKQNINCNEVV